MLLAFILSGFLITAFLMTVAKRVTALIRAFRLQSAFLFLYALYMALAQKHLELFIVSALVFFLKVAIIPFVLSRIVRRINVQEDLGMAVNSQVSLIIALLLSCLAYLFAHRFITLADPRHFNAFVVSLAAICIGFFIMVCRMKALSQVLGLLAMENGIFLAAAAITAGVPFFVEVAFFFDIFVFVIIVEIFVYRVNRLFTHIDTSKMDSLRG